MGRSTVWRSSETVSQVASSCCATTRRSSTECPRSVPKMSAAIMRVLCLLTRLGCVADGQPTRFDHERSTHILEDHADPTFHYIANLNNVTEFYHDLSHVMKPRTPGSTGHKEVARHLVNKMRNLGWDVEIDNFTAIAPRTTVRMKNIIATLDPKAPRRFVLACHYDSKIMREVFYAATDSAVPCTMMLNLAQTLKPILDRHKNDKHRVTLQFIFFDGEEAFERWSKTDSIYGSRHLAKRWSKDKYVEHPNSPDDGTTQMHRMDVMMLLDLLGTKNPSIPSYFGDTKQMHTRLRDIENKLHNMNYLQDHGKYYFSRSGYAPGIEDDHIPFLNKGVKILHIIPTPFPSVWHTVNDDEYALDNSTIQNLNKIFRVFVSQYLGLESIINKHKHQQFK